MSAPRKARNVQLVKIQSEERLATTSELNSAPGLVTNCREARGMGYWAATKVKGLSPEMYIIPDADTFHVVEGEILITARGFEMGKITGIIGNFGKRITSVPIFF